MTPDRPQIPGIHPLVDARGMTLIEIMIVLLILAMLAAGSIYTMSVLTHGQIKDEARRFTSAAQYTYNQAALTNRPYRLVIDLDEHTYHTEVSDSAVVIDESSDEAREAYDEGLLPEEARMLEEQRRAERRGMFSEQDHDPFGISRRASFQQAEDRVLDARTLRHGIEFEFVRTEAHRREIRNGRAVVYFYPNGMQQQAVIVMHEPSSGARMTLITEPLTGRIRTYSGDYEVPDDFGEESYDG